MIYNTTHCNYEYVLPSYNESYEVVFQGFYNVSGVEYSLSKRGVYGYNMSAHN